jgi:acetyltransferase
MCGTRKEVSEMTVDVACDAESLRPLFEPNAVALVGASPDFTRYGGRVLHFLNGFGFAGPIWPVNPKYSEIGGVECYPTLDALPGSPDHVGIAVAAERVVGVLDECGRLGVKAVTVFTAGFGETGRTEGKDLQDRLVAAARAHGIRLLGPNCNGLINWRNRLSMGASATVLEQAGRPGSIGIVSQSGGLGQVNVMWRALRAGLGVGYQASCGNEADIDVVDVAEFMVEDPEISVVLMAVEGIRDGAKLRRVAEKATRVGKAILMLKLGRSEGGSKAAALHTGSITGADDVHDAALAQMGILRVDDAQHLVHAAMLFQQRRPLTAEGLASISVSGGCLALLADSANRFGLCFPEYSPHTLDALTAIIPDFIAVANPTDLSVEVLGKKNGLARVLDAVSQDPRVGILMPSITMTPQHDLNIYHVAAANCPKPAALIWSGGCTDAPYNETDHMLDGVPVYRDVDSGLRAAGFLVRHRRFLDSHARAMPAKRPPDINPRRARDIVEAASTALGERLSKTVLAVYGLPVTQELLATSADEAVAHFYKIGTPVALKVESADVVHKTDVGGLRLGLSNAREVFRAYQDICDCMAGLPSKPGLDGILVQEMVGPGTELILGCTTDPTYGPVMAIGLGGIFAEFMGKPILRMPPLSVDDARYLMETDPLRKILRGVRGVAGVDLDALADIVVRFSWLVSDLADLVSEIDVNPIIVSSHSMTIVDAFMMRSDG